MTGSRSHSRDGIAGSEVLRLTPGRCSVLPDATGDGMAIADRVELLGRAEIAPDDAGSAASSRPGGSAAGRSSAASRPSAPRPTRAPAPAAATRRRLGDRLDTGVAVFDTLLPLGPGAADRAVCGVWRWQIVASGPVRAWGSGRCRGDRLWSANAAANCANSRKVLGPTGMARSVVVTAVGPVVADAPVHRLTAMAVAEHFRDGGSRCCFWSTA